VVTAYSGREALFYYVAAPLLRIFGTNVMATRLTSAFLGLLTVAAAIALGKVMFRNRTIALLAGAWLAISGPEIWLTRQGFRTSPQPLLEALGLWLLWIALRRSRGWAIPALLGGIFSGAALYVYMAARVFPPWLLVVLAIGAVMAQQEARARRLQQIGVFFAALVVTALPIAIFYATHWDVFSDRLSQLAPTGATLSLAQSALLHLEMFFIRGDPILRYNLDVGRPFFDPISGGLLIVGLIAAGALAVRGKDPGRLAGLCVLLAPALVAPSVIAVNGFPPSHMRSVAMVPLIFFAPALGLYAAGQILRIARLVPVLATGLLVILGVLVWRDYLAWGARPDLFFDADGDLNAAATWLEESAPPDALIYIDSDYYEHPTVLAHAIDPGRIRWMMADHLILPPPDRRAVYIFPHSVDFALWKPLLGDRCTDQDGLYERCLIEPGGLTAKPAIPLAADVGGVLRLRGADLPDVHAGGKTNAFLYWQVVAKPDRDDWHPVVALTDAWDNELGRSYPYFQYSSRWIPGEWIVQHIAMPIPEGEAPGEHRLRVTWIDAENRSIALRDAAGRFAGLWTTIAPLAVLPESRSIALPADAVSMKPGLAALVTTPPPASLRQGEHLRFAVDWYATGPDDGTITLTATGSDGRAVVLWSGDPVHGTYPFSRWPLPSHIIDRYDVPIPPDLPAGRYRIALTVSGASTPALSSTLDVMAVDRNFKIPDLAQKIDRRFGASIALMAYQVTSDAEKATITLAWQARTIPDRDYVVFVHLNNPDGTIFSQHDSPPSRPTTQWIPAEVITDTYTLPVPPGEYSISVGLYLQDNGLRLPIDDPAGKSLGDELVLRSASH
ncbi:MAG TPA: hypothetical protein VMT34_13775, partial [Aggregatilineales bacterium]|nr:hypothetical protein [Aggregatilineales bacterium]